jgi:hypothetical protein
MDQQTIMSFAVVVIVLMGAMLVGAEVWQNLRLEREQDEKRKREEAEAAQGEPSPDDPASLHDLLEN